MLNLKLAQVYANASRDELLAALDKLLDEQEDWSLQIAALNTDAAVQRVTAWNSGYRWGWRDCLRDLARKKP